MSGAMGAFKSIRATVAALTLFAVTLSGCHTMRFELTDTDHETVIRERKSYFFWGLYPTHEIDVSERCPTGAAAIREQTSFTDGLITFAFLGIWQLRSSWYYCLPMPLGGRR